MLSLSFICMLDGFFWHFFVIFSCRNSVFCKAGRSFLLRKRHFFRAKLQFLRGWVVFLSRKNGIFLRFFRKCRRRPSVGEPGGPKRAKRARANSLVFFFCHIWEIWQFSKKYDNLQKLSYIYMTIWIWQFF